MNFWILAIALLAIPAIMVCWPLITGDAKDKVIALFIVLMTPLAGILAYQYIGTPDAINLQAATPQGGAQQQADPHAAQQGQMEDLVASLQQRMNENPEDPEGWLILGRSLKAMQRFQEAETALANANRLTSNNPMIMVELAETKLFVSGEAKVGPEARKLIEDALAIDPNLQKGLWLMGMAYSQDGDDATAISYWQKLAGLLDPASGASTAVAEQIRKAQERSGVAVTTSPAPVMPAAPTPAAPTPVVETQIDGAISIPVTISIADNMAANLPPNAVLFVFIHATGGAGMPLAGKRLPPRSLPVSLQMTDADLLMPGMSLADHEQVDVSARISMSGVANLASGDLQANRVTVNPKEVSTIALTLDQRVP